MHGPVIDIRQHEPTGDVSAFVDFPATLYAGDRGWIRPLRSEARKQLSPRHNPFFEHARATLFTAWQGDRLLGRCSAQIDRAHLDIHRDATGFFGFFDSVDDPVIGRALVTAAGDWCRAGGMKRLRGPFSLSINEEVGLMVEGFEAPSMVLTPYHRPCQGGLAEAAGLEKVKDIITWQYDCNTPPPRALRALEQVLAMPEIRIRTVDKRNLAREMAVVRDIFNEAWSDNWGFVPWTDAELAKAVKEFEFILVERLALIAELDGEPVAIAMCVPNLNDMIRDMDGRLGPLSLLKLLWRVRVSGPRSAKMPLMGLRKSVRRHRRYAGLATALCTAIHHGFIETGIERAELGWTLEDNHLVNSVIDRIGGHPIKRHRIYEMSLEGAA